ncbi:hypothetical protein SmJEL517_g05699 [Synchytrium microbalum]|uniref:Protein CIP2A n=1 Tax=Synchytrium microbalum TaxID=1806994 RepID=A0A507BZX7_9FUNG|nr:uncharacterized protein SmJEL517_g05699 [Synchytrium microbalum]TPX30823.1 hypothetical protein SmJEL517_g05699 [Synchytrium microbalum]
MITSIDPVQDLIQNCRKDPLPPDLPQLLSAFLTNCKSKHVNYIVPLNAILDTFESLMVDATSIDVINNVLELWLFFARYRETAKRMLERSHPVLWSLNRTNLPPRSAQLAIEFIDIMSTWMARMDPVFDLGDLIPVLLKHLSAISTGENPTQLAILASLFKSKKIAQSIKSKTNTSFFRSLIKQLSESNGSIAINSLRLLVFLADESLLTQFLTKSNFNETIQLVFNVLMTTRDISLVLVTACIDLLEQLIRVVNHDLSFVTGIDERIKSWMDIVAQDGDALGQMIRFAVILLKSNILSGIVRESALEHGLVFTCAEIIHTALQDGETVDLVYANGLVSAMYHVASDTPQSTETLNLLIPTATSSSHDIEKHIKALTNFEVQLSQIRASSQNEIDVAQALASQKISAYEAKLKILESQMSGLEQTVKLKTRQLRLNEGTIIGLEDSLRGRVHSEEGLRREYEAKIMALRDDLKTTEGKHTQREKELVAECASLRRQRDDQGLEIQSLLDKLSPLMTSFNSLRIGKPTS